MFIAYKPPPTLKESFHRSFNIRVALFVKVLIYGRHVFVRLPHNSLTSRDCFPQRSHTVSSSGRLSLTMDQN